MAKKAKKAGKVLKTISKIITIISVVVLVFFFINLIRMRVLPSKYLYPIIIVLCIMELLFLFFAIHKKTKRKVLIINNIIMLIFIPLELFAIVRMQQTLDFLYNGLNIKITTDTYYVVANKEAKYKDLKDIKGETLYYYNDVDDIEEFQTQVKSVVKVKFKEVENYFDLFSDITTNKEKLVIVNSGNYDALLENDESYKDKIKIIGKIEYKKELVIEKNKNKITSKPFIVYLSGIDTRSSGMPSRSLSDVNMFVVVNPKTRNILLVNVPRDYYVQIHGTTGLRDKLTHAGVIGGVNLSKATIEDILGYEADYYVRVNFNAVTKLVDAVGGITVNSDVNYNISCWTDRGCLIKPGANYLNGRCALAFARERHGYSNGDQHRAENQQQVMKVLLDKIASTDTILYNFQDLLNALGGTFDTNVSTENIQELINFQINDMKGWNMSASNLTGTGGMTETYSYPQMKLSVVYPNQESIDTAKLKIKEILEEK